MHIYKLTYKYQSLDWHFTPFIGKIFWARLRKSWIRYWLKWPILAANLVQTSMSRNHAITRFFAFLLLLPNGLLCLMHCFCFKVAGQSISLASEGVTTHKSSSVVYQVLKSFQCKDLRKTTFVEAYWRRLFWVHLVILRSFLVFLN